MQTREKSNPFLDLHQFEKDYQHDGIKALLQGYFNETELFPLLEYVEIDYKTQTSLCDWNKDVIQPIEALSDANLINYRNTMISIRAASTLDQQIELYNNIFDDLFSISSQDFDYFLLLGEACGQLARCHFQLGDYESAKMYQLSLLQIQIVCLLLEYKSLDGLNIAESFNYLGIILCKQGMYELSHKCYEYALTAIECMSGQQSAVKQGELDYNIGILYFIQSGVQQWEENQEDFSEQELENKHRLFMLADHYFMTALKQGVPSEKIEPKRAILAKAIEKEKAIVELMESTVKGVIEGFYQEKLQESISPTSLGSISEVEELPEENPTPDSPSQKIIDPAPISKEEVSKQNSSVVRRVGDNTQSSLSSGMNNLTENTGKSTAVNQFPSRVNVNAASQKNCSTNSSFRHAHKTYYLMTGSPISQNYLPLLSTPFTKTTMLSPSHRSHYNSGTTTLFRVGSPTAHKQSPKPDNRNVQDNTRVQSASGVSHRR